jgi:hypothetical protein
MKLAPAERLAPIFILEQIVILVGDNIIHGMKQFCLFGLPWEFASKGNGKGCSSIPCPGCTMNIFWLFCKAELFLFGFPASPPDTIEL